MSNAKEWERLNAIFQEALERYPHSKFALHWLWNNAIATGPGTVKNQPHCDRTVGAAHNEAS